MKVTLSELFAPKWHIFDVKSSVLQEELSKVRVGDDVPRELAGRIIDEQPGDRFPMAYTPMYRHPKAVVRTAVSDANPGFPYFTLIRDGAFECKEGERPNIYSRCTAGYARVFLLAGNEAKFFPSANVGESMAEENFPVNIL